MLYLSYASLGHDRVDLLHGRGGRDLTAVLDNGVCRFETEPLEVGSHSTRLTKQHDVEHMCGVFLAVPRASFLAVNVCPRLLETLFVDQESDPVPRVLAPGMAWGRR